MWIRPTLFPTLAPDEVHVWRASLVNPARLLSVANSVLAEDERARAGRYRFEDLRNRFVAVRGLLRTLLACYTGVAPGELLFTYNRYGKPLLACSHRRSFEFSVCHTGDIALLAFAVGRRVGIDAEVVDGPIEVESVARRFMTAREFAALLMTPVELRLRAFLQWWTRKEAYLKGLGFGLAEALDSFEIASERPLLSRLPGPREANWIVRELEAEPRLVSSLALEGEIVPTISYWEWHADVDSCHV